MEDTRDRALRSIQKTISYLSEPEYVQLVLVTFDIPERITSMAKFFKILTQRLNLFAESTSIQNTVHHQFAFSNTRHALVFWLNSSLTILQAVSQHLSAPQITVPQAQIEDLNSFLIIVIIKLQRLFQKTIWKEYM